MRLGTDAPQMRHEAAVSPIRSICRVLRSTLGAHVVGFSSDRSRMWRIRAYPLASHSSPAHLFFKSAEIVSPTHSPVAQFSLDWACYSPDPRLNPARRVRSGKAAIGERACGPALSATRSLFPSIFIWRPPFLSSITTLPGLLPPFLACPPANTS
jgi:hypothetical protein